MAGRSNRVRHRVGDRWRSPHWNRRSLHRQLAASSTRNSSWLWHCSGGHQRHHWRGDPVVDHQARSRRGRKARGLGKTLISGRSRRRTSLSAPGGVDVEPAYRQFPANTLAFPNREAFAALQRPRRAGPFASIENRTAASAETWEPIAVENVFPLRWDNLTR